MQCVSKTRAQAWHHFHLITPPSLLPPFFQQPAHVKCHPERYQLSTSANGTRTGEIIIFGPLLEREKSPVLGGEIKIWSRFGAENWKTENALEAGIVRTYAP